MLETTDHPDTALPLHPALAPQEMTELVDGLLAPQAEIAPKYFYDELGSRLFTAITQLPEYYPTRVETSILQHHGTEIGRRVGAVHSLIDLGAGDCVKAERLFDPLHPAQYVPIDISAEYLQAAADRLDAAYPDLEVRPLAMDFSKRFALPNEIPPDGRLFFYPGSSIGNWSPDDALSMLRRIHDCCPGKDCGLLIGIDRVKPAEVLVAAYDDPLQVTAAFNRNVLLQMNRLLQSDFQLEHWRHEARYNERESRIEMHLQATRGVLVNWPGSSRYFAPGDTILTECSYKYEPQDFADLLAAAGYGAVHHWTDDRGWFSIFHARA